MTPVYKSDARTITLIERKATLTQDEERSVLHAAGGKFAGFVVNNYSPERIAAFRAPHFSFKFNVFVRNTASQQMQQETRTIQFIFCDSSEDDRIKYCDEFFRIMFKNEFPKDYFTFILLLMQMIKGFKPIDSLKVEIEKTGALMPIGSPTKESKSEIVIVTEKILEFLEKAFPDTISVEELAALTQSELQFVYDILRDLNTRNLVKYFDDGTLWMRNIVITQDEDTHEVRTIQQNERIVNDDQPTVAIITLNYYEKLAVDAMMTNKITFVRHKPEGESNVYTIGNIGAHRVVSTKLPSLNRDSRSSKISSGNTTTRLLGMFQRIEHVLLVGCGGAVPRFTDYENHPRRGDIVVSYPQMDSDQNFVYGHFDVQKSQGGSSEVVWKTWKPGSMQLYRAVSDIRKTYNANSTKPCPWENYLNEGIRALGNDELDCRRPAEDKLFFTVNESRLIEMRHPEDPSGVKRRNVQPVLRFGAVGGGEKILKTESLRQKMSNQFGVVCFDSDLDQVMEAIDGNRNDSFILIRAIADYHDGTTSKEWQPYAALCAAAFMKTLLCALPAR